MVVMNDGLSNDEGQDAAAVHADKKRRLRLELEDLEYSLAGLNDRLERIRMKRLPEIQADKAQVVVEWESLKKQQAELKTKKIWHEDRCNRLETHVQKLRTSLERWRKNPHSAVTEDEWERLEEFNSQLVDDDDDNNNNNNVAETNSTNNDGATSDQQSSTLVAATTTRENNALDEWTTIDPWPTRTILTSTWSKFSDRFLLHFRHPQRITEFLHMSWREVLSCPTNDQVLFRREGLWRTALDVRLLLGPINENQASVTATTSAASKPSLGKRRMNPDISLCPYELQGECADDECVYQHTVPRSTGSVTPRELLPLPKLEFEMKPVQPQKNSDRRPTGIVGKAKPTGNFSTNQDFVQLPESEETTALSKEETEPFFPWTTDRRLPNATGCTSRLVYEELGVRLEQGETNNESYIDMDPGTAMQLLASYQWTLHAGRHDLATALIKAYEELNGEDHYTEMLKLQRMTQRDKISNVFTRPFEAHLDLTLAYAVAEFESKQGEKYKEGRALINKISKGNIEQAQKSRSGVGKVPFVQQINHEWELIGKEAGGSEGIEALIAKTSRSRNLRNDIQYNCSLDDALMILTTAVELAQIAPVRNTNDKRDFVPAWSVLTVLPIFAQAIFGALGCAARHFDESNENNDLATFRRLVSKVDGMLDKFCAWSHDIFQTDFLLAPLYAANISLAATLRRYNLAQKRLVRLLSDRHFDGSSKVYKHFGGTLMPFSELLWSQLIQLQATLPNRLQATLTLTANELLPADHQKESKAIENALTKRGVFPCHIILRNDTTLVKVMNQLNQGNHAKDDMQKALTSSFFDLHDRLHEDPSNVVQPMVPISFIGQPLNSLRAYQPSSSLQYSIPQSVLLAGTFIESLNLSATGLQYLHPTFGTYFPNLKVLDVSSNALETLPLSIGRLASLESLNVDYNGLSSLPPFQLKKLTSLSAVGNKISILPASISECIELQTIDLIGNPLSKTVAVTVSKLPKLLSFKYDEIKKVAKKVRWAS